MTADIALDQEQNTPNEGVLEQEIAEVEIEVINDEPDLPGEAEQEEPKKAFNPRTDKVEFTTPEQQEKFNYMYKQAKQSDARNQMLTDLLQEQQKQLDQLKARFTNTDEADAEKVLMDKIRVARNEGNDEAEFAAINALAEFKAEKKFSKVNKPADEPAPVAPKYDPKDESYVESYMTETDENGNVMRPWLNENNPEFENVIKQLEIIAHDYIGDPAALQKSLARLDKVMADKKEPPKPKQNTQQRGPNPMAGGNLTNNNPKGTIKMTKKELEIARKLGVTPKNYAATRDRLKERGY